MTTATLPIYQKVYISCRETFNDRYSAFTAGAIVVATIVSPFFRIGLFTAPFGLLCGAAVTFVVNRTLPERLPQLPSRIKKFFNTGNQWSRKISFNSDIMDGVLVGPIIEETFFRGILQSLLILQVGAVAGVILSSIAFAAAHYEETYPPILLSSFVGGVILGTLREKFSILTSVGYHIGFNSFWIIVPHLIRNYYRAEHIQSRNSSPSSA